MSTTNNGNQNLTFDYKMEGTSQGFNRLFHKLISSGIVSGGELSIVDGTTVSIAPFISIVEDNTKNLSVRLETKSNANVSVSVSTPYIVGRFSWLNVEDNYMDFEAVGYAELEDTDIIFGRCVYNSSILTAIDYTRKSWAHMHYEQPNDEPPFITYMHEIENKLLVGKGSAYINGSLVEFNTVQESPTFDTAVSNGRIDLLVINASGTLEIIKGVDEENPTMPKIPYGTLAIAKITLPRNPSKISGDMVEYIYNNHFQSQNSPTSIEQLSPEIQAIINQSFVQVGMVLPFAGPNIPTGYLLCDGRNVSKTTYARLYEVLKDAETGLCIYGEDSEEEGTFKLPNLKECTVKGVGVGPGQDHVKSGGLALGEFIDDRVQNHVHLLLGETLCIGSGITGWTNQNISISAISKMDETGGIKTNNVNRFGITTEVKAVGMNFIIRY